MKNKYKEQIKKDKKKAKRLICIKSSGHGAAEQQRIGNGRTGRRRTYSNSNDLWGMN